MGPLQWQNGGVPEVGGMFFSGVMMPSGVLWWVRLLIGWSALRRIKPSTAPCALCHRAVPAVPP